MPPNKLLADKKYIKEVVGTPTNTSTGSSSGYMGHGGGWGSYSGYNMDPTFVFKAHGIEFWGSARSNLHDVEDLSKTDLIVNCSGIEFKNTPFVKKAPDWIDLPGKTVSGIQANQIVLDWKDMSPPPIAVNIEFWEDIISQAKENEIKRIFSCCGAGQGRTGTALSAFLLASRRIDEPDIAINFIRTRYSEKAVETEGQEIYLFNLIYQIEALFNDASRDQEEF